MPLKSTVLGTNPTSYWPLDDARGSGVIRDECGLHDGWAGIRTKAVET